MRDATAVPATVGGWFRRYREQYRWPETSARERSEKRISELAAATRSALDNEDSRALKGALIEIHRWKTSNIFGTTDKYIKTLEGSGADYLKQLLGMSTFRDTDELEKVLRHLKIDESNLPVCTAIASFLYGRKEVPIIDNYVAQFFARRFNINRYDADMQEILGWIADIDFKLQTSNRKLRLAVYNPGGFEHNLRLYIGEFVPECERLAKALNTGDFSYSDIYVESRKFSPIDVEMSIFSWAMKNRKLADVTPTEHHYVIRKEGILSREPIVRGTRTPVRALVELTRLGYTPEEILEYLPHLSMAAIYDALSYYDGHTKEIEEHIERNRIPANLIHPSVREL